MYQNVYESVSSLSGDCGASSACCVDDNGDSFQYNLNFNATEYIAYTVTAPEPQPNSNEFEVSISVAATDDSSSDQLEQARMSIQPWQSFPATAVASSQQIENLTSSVTLTRIQAEAFDIMYGVKGHGYPYSLLQTSLDDEGTLVDPFLFGDSTNWFGLQIDEWQGARSEDCDNPLGYWTWYLGPVFEETPYFTEWNEGPTPFPETATVNDSYNQLAWAGQALQRSADLIAPGAQVFMEPLPPGAAAAYSTGRRRHLTSAPSSSVDPFGLSALVWWPPAYSNVTAILFGSQLVNNISSVMASFSSYGVPFSPPQSQVITTTYAPPPPVSAPPPPSSPLSQPPKAPPPTGLAPLVAPSSPVLTPTSTASVAQFDQRPSKMFEHDTSVPVIETSSELARIEPQLSKSALLAEAEHTNRASAKSPGEWIRRHRCQWARLRSSKQPAPAASELAESTVSLSHEVSTDIGLASPCSWMNHTWSFCRAPWICCEAASRRCLWAEPAKYAGDAEKYGYNTIAGLVMKYPSMRPYLETYVDLNEDDSKADEDDSD
ncbi:hypothetical protein WJX77_003330 [Trebouxia sp. C0004]